ncbi:uncharacterized protein LOC125959118 isoform X2 [Anopheles darlingi]|uniref:uncharacterized protein LOC125959118 isoform X2 n=1 Tax=Anopheles darlingi TaxID=43151 RepID=UPI0021002B8B|nr:uncharacterized protein LOC125959118 isoform X2 [Anopheles darlingi]
MNSRIKEDVSRLFEFWCEIAPGKPDDPTAPGYIVESFPESFKDAKVIADIPAFAYPCAFESRTIQVHSFVLTNIDSKWRFGFCRHDPKSPTAMVIVTYLPWHDTFMRFLNVLADIKKNRPDEFGAFLAESYGKGVPEPGACLKLSYDRPVQTFSFQRPQQFQLPSIPENHNLNQYYNFVEPKFMIGIFAAMLAERRIIFVSRRLDILSSCVQAANAFLYPMVWQHIFIPVLPMQMVDILGAPMPFLIGVPEAVYETLRREEIGDVVILNCDKRTLETPFDDVKSMPPELVASLKKQLSNPADHRGDRVSKIFLGILVQLIGGYRDAVKFNDKITFDPDTFIESRPSHLRAFLSNMLQLQIFQQFIEERLDMLNTGQGFSDEFEVEYFRYAEKSGRKVKQYKDLLKNFKDKVKEGGKGVKTAYKGLRSKFRETTPPKTKLDSHSSMHLHHGYDVGGHHQSAPNSPVFNKRPQTIALADDVYHTHHPHQTLTPSSTSLYNSPHIMLGSQHHQLGRSVAQSNGGAAGSSSMSSGYHTVTGGAGGGSSSSSHMNNNLSYGNGGSNTSTTINNNTSTTLASSSASDIRSPTLSPTSSNSSSEMNLWQEMQHHLTLFKSPAVNRNLKPSLSGDGSSPGSRPSSRAGAPAVSPPGSTNHTHSALPRIQESSHQAPSQPLLSLDLEQRGGVGGSSRHQNVRNNNGSSSAYYHENNDDDDDDDDDGQANFDLSPDAPCPPIPPRRFQSAADALAAIQISPPPMSPPSTSSSCSSPYRTYNNFIPPLPRPKSSSTSASYGATTTPTVVSSSRVDQTPSLPSPPPPPPLKATEERRELPSLLDADEDQLITITTTTNGDSQLGAGSLTNAVAAAANTTTTSMSMTFVQSQDKPGTGVGGLLGANSNHHILPPLVQGPTVPSAKPPLLHAYTLPHPPKVQAPQPPQRPPLAPKPTFRKESQNGDTPDFLSSTGGGTATPPPNEDSLDLITLDTTNSSFELEDFDPLNERAKPIAATTAIAHANATGTALTNSNIPSYHQHSVAGLPIAAGVTVPTASFPSTSLGVNNPVYPYFTPLYQQNVSPHHHQPHRSQPPPFPSSLGAQGDTARAGVGTAGSGSATAGSSSTSDDFELLRNYGLDKFALLDLGDGGKQTALLHMNGTGMDARTTFDQDILRKSIPSSNINGRSSFGSSNGSRNSGNKLSTSIEGIAPNSRPPAPPPSGYNGHSKPAFSNWTTFD